MRILCTTHPYIPRTIKTSPQSPTHNPSFIHPLIFLTSHPLASRRKSETLGSAGSTILGTCSKTTLGKALPDLALVSSLGKSGVGIDDGVSGLDHVGVARLPIKR